MGFVERELGRIQCAITNSTDPHFASLMAAQQALAWALDPRAYAPPLAAITGNPEAAEDCSAETRRPRS